MQTLTGHINKIKNKTSKWFISIVSFIILHCSFSYSQTCDNTIYYSAGNGNFTAANIWSTTSGGVGNYTYNAADPVKHIFVIENGDLITINTPVTVSGLRVGRNGLPGRLNIQANTNLMCPTDSIQINNNGLIILNGNYLVAPGANNKFAMTGGELQVNAEIPDFLHAFENISLRGGTINYSLTGDQTINPILYFNLVMTGPGIKHLYETIDVIGNLGIAVNTQLRIEANNSNINLSGNWINNGTYNANGLISFVEFNNGTSNQTITGYTEFQGLQINKAAGRYLTLNNNIRIINNLSFNGDGILQLGTNNLILSPAVANILSSSGTFHSNRMIQQNGSNASGRIIKELTSASNFFFQFPTGTGTSYAPIAIGPLNAAVAGTGQISVNTVPFTSALNNIVKRYVTVTSTGISNITQAPLRFYYDNTEEAGLPNLVTVIVGAVTQNAADAEADLNTNYFGTGIENTVLSGEWRFVNSGTLPVTYYSFQNGDWNTPDTWTTDPTGTTQIGMPVAGPTNIDHVVILNGRTVDITNNNNTISSLTIQEGGILDIGTSVNHSFGVIYGAGTLRLSSNNIPAGDFTNFVSAEGGTFEYYNYTGQLRTNFLNYNNIIFSGTGTKTIASTSAITYNLNGNLEVTAGNVTIGSSNNSIRINILGNLNVRNGATLRISNNNTTHQIFLGGNLTNNGTIRFTNLTSPVQNAYYTSTPTNGMLNITFNNITKNQQVICNGITDFYRIIVDKGVDATYSLEIVANSVNNFRLFGRNDQADTGGETNNQNDPIRTVNKALAIQNGTLILGNNILIPSLTQGENYRINESAALIIDGADVTNVINTWGGTSLGNRSIVVFGLLQVNDGTLDLGQCAGAVIRTYGSLVINGGSTRMCNFRPSVTSAAHRGTFIMTGGVLNCDGDGEQAGCSRFSVPYATMVFKMTGGTINITNPTTNYGLFQIGVASENFVVTGGNINCYLPSTNDAYGIATTIPIYNLSIYKTGAGNSVARIQDLPLNLAGATTVVTSPLTIKNNFLISNNTAPARFDANNYDVFINGNFTLDANTSYLPGNNRTCFIGHTSNQTATINSNVTFNHLVIENTSASGVVTLGGNRTVGVTGNLFINSGTLNDGGKTITVQRNAYNSGIHTGTGRIRMNNTATAIDTIGGSGNGIWGNLEIDDANGINLISKQTINNTLFLTNGILNIGSNNLTIASTGSISVTTPSSTRMIRTNGLLSDGGITRVFSASSPSFTYPIGSGTAYTPITANITATSYGTINIRPVNKRHPALSIPPAAITDALSYFWKVSSQGFAGVSSGNLQFTYQTALIPGGDGSDNSFRTGRSNASTNSWETQAGVDAANNRFSYSISTTGFNGDYTAGNNTAFNPTIVLESISSGNWENVSTWRKLQGGAEIENPSNSIPNAYTPVIIRNGHTVTVSSTTTPANSSTLEIHSTAILDLGTTISALNHNFGTFISQPTGNGTIRISSSNGTARFPAGDFGDFFNENGGTVEYYRTSVNFTLPVNSIAPSNLLLQNYRHLTIIPDNGTITFPNQNIRIFGNLTTNAPTLGSRVLLSNNANGDLQINGNLNVSGQSSLLYQNANIRNLILKGNVTIDNNATLGINNSATAINNTITIGGNLVNNGTTNLRNGAAYVNATFTGNSNNSITGTGANTTFNRLIVDKGTDTTYSLEVNAASFNLQATTSGTSKALELVNGTFKLSSDQTITLSSGNNNGANFQIPSTAQLWINNGNATIDATGTNAGLFLGGKLRISENGEVNISSSGTNNNFIEYPGVGRPTIEVNGGQLTVGSQIRRPATTTYGSLVYIQTGGNVTIGTQAAPVSDRGVFEILNSGSEFRMTGGTLTIVRPQATPSIAALYLNPSYSDVQNSTIQIGSNGITANIQINTSIPLWNLTIGTASGTSITSGLSVNNLQVARNLTIYNGATLNTNNLNVSIGGDFISSGTYSCGTNTTIFNGNLVNQNITGNLSFNNMTIANTSGSGLVTLNNNIQVNKLLTLSNGTLSDNGNVVTVTGNIENSAAHESSGTGRILMINTVPQYLSGSGLGIFGSMEINNSAGVELTTNQTINNRLTFNQGRLNIASNRLTLGNNFNFTGTASATSMICTSGSLTDNGVQLMIPSGNFDYTIPLGVPGKYTPARYTSNNNTNNGSINVKPINTQHPLTSDGLNKELNYFWRVTSTGLTGTTITHEYNYVDMDVIGRGIETEFVGARYYNDLWTTEGTVNTSQNRIFFTNVPYINGDYTIGEASEFGIVGNSYQTAQSGNWEDGSTWVGGQVPVANARVIINPNHIVTISSHTKRTYSMYLRTNSELIVNSTIGHNFGTVHGTGMLTIGNNLLPAGDYTGFVAADSGTIKYTHSDKIPNVLSSYNNLIISSSGTLTLPPKSPITINGNLTIESGTLSASGQNLILYRNFTINGAFSHGVSNVEFRGANMQTVSGTGTISFWNLTMNNAAGVTFNESATINNSLIFSNGIVNTSSGREIIFNTNATSQGASDASYINGVVRKVSNSTPFAFPVGSNIQYRPLTLGAFTGEYSAQYINTAYNSSQVTSPLTRTSDSEHWILNRLSGSSNPNVTLGWTNMNQIPVTNNLANLRIANWNGSNWLESSATPVFSGTLNAGSIMVNNFAPTGRITFATTELPVVHCPSESNILYQAATTVGADNYVWSSDNANLAVVTANISDNRIAYVTFSGINEGTGNIILTVYRSGQVMSTKYYGFQLYPARPVINPVGGTTFCNGGSVQLQVPSGFSNYEWSSGENTESITVEGTGTYFVRVQHSNGCWSSNSESINITELTGLTVGVVSSDNSLTER